MIAWFVGRFLDLLYTRLAWAYDTVAWLVSFGQWNAWASAALPHLRGSRVLEIAHGPGHLLVRLGRTDQRPVGLDISPAMGRLAGRRLARAGLSVPLVRARAQALPFRRAAFDSVVTTFPTEFILEAATLREVARVLGEPGRLVIVPGVAFSPDSQPYRFLAWLYRVTGQQDLPTPPDVWETFDQAGFELTRQAHTLGAVQVQIVVAHKHAKTRLN